MEFWTVLEKRMNKPGLKHLIILCGILFVILLLVTVNVLKHDRQFDDFYLGIYEVDKNINTGYFNRAAELLAGLYDEIFNVKTALIFLKRTEQIASATNNYSIFKDYSLKLYRRFSSDIEIAAIHAYALSKNKNYQQALMVSDEKLKKSVYRNIYLLNTLENNTTISDLKIIESFNNYNFIFEKNYNPETLKLAAEKHWDERYIVDSILLLMKEGKIEDAKMELSGIKDDLHAELKMYVLYDNKDYKNAEKYFYMLYNNPFDLDDHVLFTGCDILMKNLKYTETSGIYSEYLDKNPSVYSLPYRNLYSMNKKNADSVKWLVNGLKYFPDSNDLLIPSAWKFYLNNDLEDLKAAMNQLEQSGDDSVKDLFEVNVLFAGRNPEHVIGNYWNIYNASPESRGIAVSFADYLLRNHEYSQLEMLLNKFEKYNGPDDWVFISLAIEKVMSGDFDAALDNINKAIEISNSYEANYNKAVILESGGRTNEAMEYYTNALDFEESTEINKNNLGKIYFKLSETNYNIGNYRDAYIYILMALDIDPANMKNKLLMRKIKEEYNDQT